MLGEEAYHFTLKCSEGLRAEFCWPRSSCNPTLAKHVIVALALYTACLGTCLGFLFLMKGNCNARLYKAIQDYGVPTTCGKSPHMGLMASCDGQVLTWSNVGINCIIVIHLPSQPSESDQILAVRRFVASDLFGTNYLQ